jgi:ribonuclease-3
MEADLEALETELGYRFEDRELLRVALSHKSLSEGTSENCPDNERMEFLGDSILGFITSEWLLQKFPAWEEGRLSKVKAHLVSASYLYQAAHELDLGPHLLMGRGEELSGGRQKKRLLANAMEALIAAVYLDGGIEAARGLVIRQLLAPFDASEAEGREVVNFKGALKELSESLSLPPPYYSIIEERGPDHAKTFVVEVRVGQQYSAKAEGVSKKGASQTAAKAVLERLITEHPEANC